MACIKGYDTITGKPCVDKLAKKDPSRSEYTDGPHEFYQNPIKYNSVGKPSIRKWSQEEAIRLPHTMTTFDSTYRDLKKNPRMDADGNYYDKDGKLYKKGGSVDKINKTWTRLNKNYK